MRLPFSNVRVRRAPALVAAAASLVLGGCSGLTDLVGRNTPPPGGADPATYKTPDGARAMYRYAIASFKPSFLGELYAGALLTDEATAGVVYNNSVPYTDAIDVRSVAEGTANYTYDRVYAKLQWARTNAIQASGALATYDTSAPPALRGHLFVLRGYAEVLLADLFCSGVPLSELEFEGDFAYKAGSTTQEIYAHAITLFDSALVLSADSTRFVNLARVGKGRALLAFSADSAAAAARVVAQVPDDFAYEFPMTWHTVGIGDTTNVSMADFLNVSDREGGDGLPYQSSGDPRTAVVSGRWGTNRVYNSPVKYGTPSVGSDGHWQAVSTVVVASGIEARLIEAEAALRADSATGGTQWLDILNHLRATATVPGMTGPLPALDDPGTWSARVDTFFAERAAWLFLDGHRQGDLRRLIRQYGRRQDHVYPSGPFPGLAHLFYGADVTAPVPSAEHSNPEFTGCFNREA